MKRFSKTFLILLVMLPGLLAFGPKTLWTERVSVDSSGVEANGHSFNTSISADGRYVVFESEADNLAPGSTARFRNIILHDRQTGETTLLSTGIKGQQANGDSLYPAISADGNNVTFESDASNLVDGDTNGCPDIFIYERGSGKISLASVSTSGIQGNNGSAGSPRGPSISADGRYVTFSSWADNLVPVDTNGLPDIFVHDRVSGDTTLASVDSSNVQGNGMSVLPSISADGRLVAFQSDSTNLVPGLPSGIWRIYVHNRQTGETRIVTHESAMCPVISADGNYVAFESDASNLVPGDTNGMADIFVYDLRGGATIRVSIGYRGMQGNGDSKYVSSISADGRIVAFESFATNLASGDTNGKRDVFVHNRETGLTGLASRSLNGGSGNDDSRSPSISADGHYLTFESGSDDLVRNDTNGKYDIFVIEIIPHIP